MPSDIFNNGHSKVLELTMSDVPSLAADKSAYSAEHVEEAAMKVQVTSCEGLQLQVPQ